jgi:acetyltransferase-like isoleucine patch superfamily enzyme
MHIHKFQKMVDKCHNLAKKCHDSDSSFILVLSSHLRYKISRKNILANNNTIIKGHENIHTSGLLEIGMSHVGFMHKHDITYLNINGSLVFNGDYSIGKGCRFDIGSSAVAKMGRGFVNANTNFIIMNGITIGNDCAISWNCEFLDEDFHTITYSGKNERSPSIEIGNHVWIGSNVTVLKGSKIPDGCVVASRSVVCSVFENPNCLLAGNPARVIKENIEWK